MDQSMGEGDSLLSLPGPSNLRDAFHTDQSHDGPNHEQSGHVDVDGDGDGDDAAEWSDEVSSETSSALFDPEADPQGWAKRLDELAGVLEMDEEESRAMRWGPPLNPAEGKSHHHPQVLIKCPAPHLPLDEFKTLLNHHLTNTEWKYPPMHETSNGVDVPFDAIRVVGGDWVGKQVESN